MEAHQVYGSKHAMESATALAFAGSVRLGKSTADRKRLDMVKIWTAQAELWRIGVAQLL